MIHDDEIRAEREAAEKMVAALDTIAEGLQWYWHWGDGQGGYVLEELAGRVRARGYKWPADEPTQKRKLTSKAVIKRSLSKRVMERDAYRCVTCGTHIDLCCDHIVPESKGGETSFANLQTMCRPCNSRKGVSMPDGAE